MRVDISGRAAVTDISVRQYPGTVNVTQYLLGLSGHDVSDLEFALAQRKAMSRRCTQAHGEHTCGLDPDHGQQHLCRACTETWPVTRTAERAGADDQSA